MTPAGHFGPYGGVFVAETLRAALDELTLAYSKYREDPEFQAELADELEHYVGRPSPDLSREAPLARSCGGAQIYLKREDLNHTGAHKVNNTVGQALLAKRMGKPRVIAETGAGQHGVATATVAARYGMECVVYMGTEDIARQAQNVYRMKLLGATVVPVESGSKTLKDALNEAMRDWVTNVGNTFYIIGTVAGPHPYPMMVRDFNSIVGKECVEQMPAMRGPPARRGARLRRRRLERDGHLLRLHSRREREADRRRGGRPGARDGQARGVALARARRACCTATARTSCRTRTARSSTRTRSPRASTIRASAPSTRGSRTRGRAQYVSVTDDEALAAFHTLCRTEGIIPALESSHAVAYAMKIAPTMAQGQDPAREPLRPRRQGHAHGREGLGAHALMSRIAATFEKLRAAAARAR